MHVRIMAPPRPQLAQPGRIALASTEGALDAWIDQDTVDIGMFGSALNQESLIRTPARIRLQALLSKHARWVTRLGGLLPGIWC